MILPPPACQQVATHCTAHMPATCSTVAGLPSFPYQCHCSDQTALGAKSANPGPNLDQQLLTVSAVVDCPADAAAAAAVQPTDAAAAAAMQPAADAAATEALIAAQSIPQPEPVPQATEDQAAVTTDPAAAPLVPVTPDRLFAKTIVANRFDNAFRTGTLGFGFSGSGFLVSGDGPTAAATLLGSAAEVNCSSISEP